MADDIAQQRRGRSIVPTGSIRPTVVNGAGQAVLVNPTWPYVRAKITTTESGVSIVDVYVCAKAA